MSGHSKWSQIKRQKGANDAKRGALFTKLAREIITAARQGGGDQDANYRLRMAVDKAKANSMPAENIKRAIERASGSGADAEQLGLLAEAVEEHGGDDPGCLFTTFLYERDLVDEATRATIAAAMHSWRDRTREKLERAAERHPPQIEVDLEAVADQLTTLLEGAYVLSRALDDPRLIRGQLEQFRTYLALLFAAPSLTAPSPS